MHWKSVAALACGVALASTPSVLAQDTYAVSRGKLALQELEPLPDGYNETYYFKLTLANRPFGYSEMTLTAQKDEEGKLWYHYRHDTKTKAPNGNRFNTVIETKMTPRFSPVEINTVKTTITGTGQEYVRRLTVVLGPKEIVQTRMKNDKYTTEYFDRPEGPFVFATELLLERIKFDKFKSFDWTMFDPNRCQTTTLRFLVNKMPDLTHRTIASTGAASATKYYFTHDAEQRLTGWGEDPPAATAERIDREALDALLETLGLE
ncbi:MAG: hypothetical protein ACE5GE_01950 [Phycisphaerae bacterium]